MGSFPWDEGDQPSEQDVRKLLDRQFPIFSDRSIELLGSGWDNAVYLVGGSAVFRFPRTDEAAALLETETRVLPKIASDLPIAIPRPRWIGAPSSRFARLWAGHEWVPGTPAHERATNGAQRESMALALAEFLSALHGRATDDLELPGDDLDRLSMRSRMPMLEERLAVLERRGLLQDPQPWLELVGEPASYERDRRVIVHGDLYAAHVLCDESGRLSGVIDWGDVHLGDRAVDLSVSFGFLPPRARRRFFDAYGDVDESAALAARRRAAFHAVSVAWYASEVGRGALRDEALRAMQYVLL